VADSIRGDRLCFADPGWLHKLRFGASLKLWNILIAILGGMIGGIFVGMLGLPVQLLSMFNIVAALLGFWATYCITTQEPRTSLTEDPVTLRKIIRTCAVTTCVGGIAQQLAGIALAPGTAIRGAHLIWILIGLVSGIAGLVVLVGEMIYFRRFALRAPDVKLARSTGRMMWGLGITFGLATVGGVVLSLIAGFIPGATTTTAGTPGAVGVTTTATGGPAAGLAVVGACLFVPAMLIFFIWYLVLLSRYRKLIQNAWEHSQRTAQVQ